VSVRGALFDYAEGNDETLAVTRRHEQLVPMATLDPRAASDFTDEISRMTDQGVRVFRFFREYQRWPITYLPFLRCLEQLSGQRAILVLQHLGDGNYARLLEILKDVELPVIITSVPYSQARELVCAMQANERIYAGTRLLSSPTMLGAIRDEVGLTRLLFESGAPMFYMESAIGIVARSNLEEREREQVFGANLTRLMET
jgi:predicted TIM-barrel fold metal-dependent hydrolase